MRRLDSLAEAQQTPDDSPPGTLHHRFQEQRLPSTGGLQKSYLLVLADENVHDDTHSSKTGTRDLWDGRKEQRGELRVALHFSSDPRLL